MRNITYILFIVLLSACASGGKSNLSYNEAVDRNNKKLATEELKQDARFLVDAKSYSLLVEQMSQLALEKGYASAIQNFATKIRQDHTTLNNEVNQLAENYKITIPKTMSESHKLMLDELSNATRQEFDRKFIRNVERVYEDNIDMYKNIATTANNDEVRAFAARKLSILRANQARANELEDQLLSMAY